MTTARDIITLVIQSIVSDIRTAESNYAYAEGERSRLHEKKMQALKNGEDYFIASDKYNDSLGFHSGCAFENEERIGALNRRLDYWKSLDERCAEEEMLEKAEEDEEEDEE